MKTYKTISHKRQKEIKESLLQTLRACKKKKNFIMHQYCCTYTHLRSQKLHFVLGRKSRWMPHFKSCNRELEGGNKRDGLNRGIKHTINQSASFLHSRPGEQFDSVGAQQRSRAGVAHKSPSALAAKPRWHRRCPYCRSSVVLVRIRFVCRCCEGEIQICNVHKKANRQQQKLSRRVILDIF